jgi:putative oxidoreductase
MGTAIFVPNKYYSMKNKLKYGDHILAVIRITLGLLLLYVGREMFNAESMKGYTDWLTDIKFPMPKIMAYMGKLAEIAGGLSLVLGIGIRWTAIPAMIAMLVINFIMGDGNLWGGTFLAFLLILVFFIQGEGIWTVSGLVYKQDDNK